MILTAIIAVNIFLLSRLAFLPYPELFVYPYLTNHGLLPYAQILDQHFPGLMFLPVNLDNLGMTTPGTARIVQFLLVILAHIVLYKVAKKIFKSGAIVFVPNILYLFWQPVFEGWVLWIDSFLPVFYLTSFYFLLCSFESRKARNLMLAGLALGLATVFKQIVIPLAFLVAIFIFIKNKNIKDVFWFAVGYVPAPLLMTLYMIGRGLFPDFWYWSVTYNLTVFSQFGRKFSTLAELIRFTFAFGPAVLLIIARKSKYYLALLFLVGALAAAYARFDFVHLQPALPFALIGAAFALDYFSKHRLTAVAFVYAALAVFVVFKFYRTNLSNRIYFFGEEEISIANKVKAATVPGDKIFVYGTTPNIYQMTGTLPAGNVFVFQFPWFTMLTEGRLLEGLVEDKPKIIVADRSVTIENQKLVDFTKDLNAYISDNYDEIDRVGEKFDTPKEK